MILQRRAAGIGPLDIETALLDSAGDDHAAEAGALLLTSLGNALPQLHRLGLITVDICLEGTAQFLARWRGDPGGLPGPVEPRRRLGNGDRSQEALSRWL